ncbi:hypothetical protein FWK35_00034146 [Aphis craccivora]|uniref:Uncharacterized protein n=1 Tax=Aphis craccivora TaxID=307492 RepID=A0A6G0YRV2_APHCR|nr:hypothetical protein FWK35_00034146 [Aphis craccivora]
MMFFFSLCVSVYSITSRNNAPISQFQTLGVVSDVKVNILGAL